jgi:DNA end-binding protein Ku
MPPRSLRSATLTFGLVTIPVRFYTATSSQSPHSHLIHEQCGSRIKQQLFCPRCGRVVERNELVRGYEVHGHSENDGEYVFFTEEELRALEMATSPALDIIEFAPLDKTMADTGLAAVILCLLFTPSASSTLNCQPA